MSLNGGIEASMRWRMLGASLVAWVWATTAQAEDRYARADVVSGDIGFLSLDDSGTGFMLTLGSRFMPHIGAELFYADLGEVDDGTIICSAQGCPGFSADLSAKVYGAGLSLRYALADSAFFLGGQGGIQRLEIRGEYLSGGFPGVFVSRYDLNDTGAYLGVAVGYQVSENLDISARWTRYSVDLDIGNRNLVPDLELASLGAEFRF